jgi:hypothetical protein
MPPLQLSLGKHRFISRTLWSVLVFGVCFHSSFAQGSIWDELEVPSTQTPPPPANTADTTTQQTAPPVTADTAVQQTAPLVTADTTAQQTALPPVTADTTAQQTALPPVTADTAAQQTAPPVTADTAAQQTALPPVTADTAVKSTLSRREILGPVKVTKVNSIDQMKGNYKSPKIAMFMSLALPGSGQFYVGGANQRYIRGALYTLAEVALWLGMYKITVLDYNDKVKEYQKYANTYFALLQYEEKLEAMYSSLNEEEKGLFVQRYAAGRSEYCTALYGSPDRFKCNSLAEDFSHFTNIQTNPGPLGDYKDVSNRDDLYRVIGNRDYVYGWQDVSNEAAPGALQLFENDYIALGESAQQRKYQQIRKEANDLANKQTLFIGGLIFIRIVSAVDAALSAQNHNKSLYQENVGLFDRLQFSSFIVQGKTLRPGIHASLRF